MTNPQWSVAKRVAPLLIAGAITVALVSTSGALLARLTRIPLGRGTATITWTGVTGITPTIRSITGKADGYAVSGGGQVPRPPYGGTTASTLPSHYPIADVTGKVGGSPFTLRIVLSLSSPPTSIHPQDFGYVRGTFRNQPVRATLTANLPSSTFSFDGTIGTLRVSGTVTKFVRHGRSETAHAVFDVTR